MFVKYGSMKPLVLLPGSLGKKICSILAEAIDMHLILEGREAPVGMFRADLIARDVHTGHLVLIENQLERTDHGHLGQLLAYASGLKAGQLCGCPVCSLMNIEQLSIG